jgi:hypothetical protein
MERFSLRLLPFTGVLSVTLWLAGALIINVLTSGRGVVTPDEHLAYFREEPHAIFLGALLFQLGCLSFLFFIGSLRGRLFAAEGGSGTLSTVALAGGLGTAVFAFGIFAGHMEGALDRETLSPVAAGLLGRLSDLAFHGAQLFAIPLVTACALLTLRAPVLRRSHAWAGLALAVLLAVPHTGAVALLYGFPLWVVTTSFLLWRRDDVGGPLEARNSVLLTLERAREPVAHDGGYRTARLGEQVVRDARD